MSTDETDQTDQPDQPSGGRWRKPVLLAIVIVVAVYVLFTWVFPWVTELGLSPALD